jgi:FemAB family
MQVKKIDINWHSGFSIYASEAFLKTLGDEYGWLGGFNHNSELRCILPYTIVHKVIFRMVRFRVETIPIDNNLTIEEEKVFLNNVINYFRNAGADMIIPATTNTIFKTYPDGADAAPYGSYIIDLTQSEEVLWANLHSKHRNVVRNAMKKGVEIVDGIEFMETAHTIIRDTLKRSKIGFMGWNEFKCFFHGLNENIKILIANHEGIAQGCAVIPYSQHSAYYLYGGSIPHPLSGAMNLLQWEAIKMFRNMGVQRYDFVGVRINPSEGSKQEGLMTFKQRFGGNMVKGFMWKYSLSPLKYAVYSQAVKYLRGGDIVDAERHKLPSFKGCE